MGTYAHEQLSIKKLNINPYFFVPRYRPGQVENLDDMYGYRFTDLPTYLPTSSKKNITGISKSL